MCTVTWLRTRDGYELFCNRDELLTRKPALPPQVMTIADVQAIAPRDGDFGGSWISVNEFGLSLCLLNLHTAEHRCGKFISRGLLLMELAGGHSTEKVMAQISKNQLQQFRPFTLLALAVDQSAMIAQWNGSDLLIDRDGDGQMPLTSSSFDSARVIESRKQCFENRAIAKASVSSDQLFDFHRSHDPESGAYSACMHRSDAATVSFSQIKVDSNSIQFRYYPHSPCLSGRAEIKTLQRKIR